MSTFLQLCQRVAAESGVVADAGAPASVISQTGRLAKVVNWTAKAWETIQTDRMDWLFMTGEMTSSAVIPAARRYSAADFSLSDFAGWMPQRSQMRHRFFLYPTASGPAYEAGLHFVPWNSFYATRMRGAASVQTGTPGEYSIAPDGDLVLFPTPTEGCTISAEYRKTAQILELNDDVPSLPSNHHEIIVWRALLFLAIHDEATVQMPAWSGEYRRRLQNLVNEQTPEIRMGGEAWV